MATATIVVTYTPDGGPGSATRLAVTGFTVAGTAWASLSAAQIAQAKVLAEGILKNLSGPGAGGTNITPPPGGYRDTDQQT
jgi:hypothetical protein